MDWKMRATEFITEIYKISSGNFVGDANDVGHEFTPKTAKPLPGGSGMLYSVKNRGAEEKVITIYNPKEKEAIGSLVLEYSVWHSAIMPNSYIVDTVAVLNKYRGQGYGLALYGIALSELKFTLIAGDSQTPNGRKSWVNLASIPGVEVKGLVGIYDETFDDYDLDTDDVIENIMNLGAQYLGNHKERHYFAFDVVEGTGELQPAIKNELSAVYSDNEYKATLYARWVG